MSNESKCFSKSLKPRINYLFLLIFSLLLISTCSIAGAENLFRVKNGRINEITSPSLCKPEIVAAGGKFRIRIDSPDAGEVEVIELLPSNGTGETVEPVKTIFSIKDTTALYDAAVPSTAATGLYDVRVRFIGGKVDTQPHSVKIIDSFKKDFVFSVIADIHFGDTRGDYFAPGADFDRLRRNILVAASEINPEFVLIAGDITSMPNDYTRDFKKAWNYFTQYCTAPLFAVPGNHDGYGIRQKKNVFRDGKIYWTSFLGPAYFYFDYGNLRVIGIDNYEWPAKFRSSSDIGLMSLTESINTGNMGPGQFEWLKETLESAEGKNKIVFAHLPFDKMKGGMKSLDGSVTIPGVPAEKIISLLSDAGVSHAFIGHMHRNEIRDVGRFSQVMTNTAGSVLYNPEQLWGFSTIHVKDWKIDSIEFTEIGFD